LFFFYPFREKQFDDFVQLSVSKIELGKIACSEQGTGEFSLTNRTKQKIPFRLDADCSCTTLEPKSGVLEPLSTARVQVKYKPKSIASSDSSLHQEGSDITINLLGNDRRLVRFIGVRAQTLFPAVFDSHGLRSTVEPFKPSQFSSVLTIAKDVDSVQLKSKPEFLDSLELIRNGTQVELRGQVNQFPGVQQGELEIEFVIRDVAIPVSLRLPVWINVENPYRIESQTLAFQPGSVRTIKVAPRFDVAKVAFVKIDSDSTMVSARIEGLDSQSAAILCGEKGQVDFPVIGRLDGVVRVTRRSGEELLFNEVLPFVISEGGLLD